MADFLLVHGSCHGAWCWRDLLPALQRRGHSARALDLPGNGRDDTLPSDVTLAKSADAILALSRPETIIMGHSWGGYPISAAAERSPVSMRGLVYLCAYVPRPGMSMVDMRKLSPRQPLLEAVELNQAGDAYAIRPDRIEDLFYHDCPPAAVSYAKALLRPQATRPQSEPISIGANFAKMPKVYIRCLQDRTIPPEYQAEMVRDWPAGSVYAMNSSHSPFFADPHGLADLMTQIAQEF